MSKVPKKIVIREDFADCALPECGKRFRKRSHNSRYCSPEHARIATNRKILERYHDKKKLPKRGRVCKGKNCGTVLSVYNRSQYCYLCMDKQGLP